MKAFFTVTTTKKVADNIEIVLKSPVHSGRSISVGKIINEDTYSVVQIIGKEDGKEIQLEDVFWLGYFTNFQEQTHPKG